MKLLSIVLALLLGGCSFTADDRRALAEDAAQLAIFRAARILRTELVKPKHGFTPEEAEKFSAWLERNAGELADRLLDRVRSD